MKKRKLDYDGFIDSVTCGLDDTEMTAQEVVEYMAKHDAMPEGVSLWEEVENSSPAHLVKNGLGYKELDEEVEKLLRAVKALGAAIRNGDPQRIADRWMNTQTAVKEIEG